MRPLIDTLREVIGPADFYIDGSWDYAAMVEYFVCALIVCIIVASVFRFLCKWVSR